MKILSIDREMTTNQNYIYIYITVIALKSYSKKLAKKGNIFKSIINKVSESSDFFFLLMYLITLINFPTDFTST